ncbi:MAG: LacI family DNA-binding transcriptional regulator [Bacteroidota bacterium]
MSFKKIKLTDIAKIHHVSVSTVSKALSGHSDIKLETKRKIIETAKKLNYVPDFYAKGLRLQKTFTIGVIIPDVLLYFNSTVLKGIIHTAKEMGYRVLLSESEHHYKDEKETIQKMMNSNVDGLLISINKESDNIDHILKASEHLPIVLFDKISDKIPLTKIVVDEEKGAFNAVEHLILQGRKRIVHIGGAKNSYSSAQRLEGYLKALKKYNIPIDLNLIYNCEEVTLDEGYKITQILLYNNIGFNALFGVTDNVAIGAIKALKEKKFRIPKDIAVAGFSDSEKAMIIEPNLTSVSQSGLRMGKTAVKYLIEEINNPMDVRTPRTIELKTTLKIRKSSSIHR